MVHAVIKPDGLHLCTVADIKAVSITFLLPSIIKIRWLLS
jgi:hypothetical protein